MGRHSKPEDLTAIPEERLVELRGEGRAADLEDGPFPDRRLAQRWQRVLDDRGESWAAAVLGRDVSRRSADAAHRPYLLPGEDRVLIAADAEEDRIAIGHLDPDTQPR